RRARSAIRRGLADAAGGVGERENAAGLGQRRQPGPARPDRPVQPALPAVPASPGPRQQRHGEGDRAVAGWGRPRPLRLLRWLPALRLRQVGHRLGRDRRAGATGTGPTPWSLARDLPGPVVRRAPLWVWVERL